MAGRPPLPELDLQTGLPLAQGLYSPELEKDACGVGFIVNIHGIKSKKVKCLGLTSIQYIGFVV